MRIAARQHGLVTRSQLLRLGMSRDAIDNRVKSRRFRPFRRGIYLLSPTIPPPRAGAGGHPLVPPRLGAVRAKRRIPSRTAPLPSPPTPRPRSGPGQPPRPQARDRDPPRPDPTSGMHDPPRHADHHPRPYDPRPGGGARSAGLEQVVAEAHRRGMASAGNLHALLGRHPRGAGTPALRALLNAEHSSAFLALGPSGGCSTCSARLDSPSPRPTPGWATSRSTSSGVIGGWRSRSTALVSHRPSDRRRDQVKDAALVRGGHAVLRLGGIRSSTSPRRRLR